MKNFIIIVETAIIAFILGGAYELNKAENDKEHRKELMDVWKRQEAEEE